MKRDVILKTVLAFAVCGALGAASYGQPATIEGLYRLTDEALFQRGCFPPCACPLYEAGLRGTFRLTLKEPGPLYDTYVVTGVNWIAATEPEELYITGEGTYRIGGEVALLHRLELDLRVGDEPVTHYDSGWVPVEPGDAAFDITISINGVYCYDTVMRVVADIVPPREIQRYALGPGSGYQTGCWPPCLCPLMETRPVWGTFGLVQLRQVWLFTEYAVVDVDWVILDDTAPTPEGTPAKGVGIYRVGGEVAPQHQMTLMLTLDGGDPLLFGSGWVLGGGDFPRINIDVSVNGFYCFDQAFYIRAWPLTPHSLTAPTPEPAQ